MMTIFGPNPGNYKRQALNLQGGETKTPSPVSPEVARDDSLEARVAYVRELAIRNACRLGAKVKRRRGYNPVLVVPEETRRSLQIRETYEKKTGQPVDR